MARHVYHPVCLRLKQANFPILFIESSQTAIRWALYYLLLRSSELNRPILLHSGIFTIARPLISDRPSLCSTSLILEKWKHSTWA